MKPNIWGFAPEPIYSNDFNWQFLSQIIQSLKNHISVNNEFHFFSRAPRGSPGSHDHFKHPPSSQLSKLRELWIFEVCMLKWQAVILIQVKHMFCCLYLPLRTIGGIWRKRDVKRTWRYSLLGKMWKMQPRVGTIRLHFWSNIFCASCLSRQCEYRNYWEIIIRCYRNPIGDP